VGNPPANSIKNSYGKSNANHQVLQGLIQGVAEVAAKYSDEELAHFALECY
jgi:hypothetical protein